MANEKIDLLVEYISKDNYIAANQLIGPILEDVQAKRVHILKEDNELNFGDSDEGSGDEQDSTDSELSEGEGEEEQTSTEGQTEVEDDIVETDSIMDEISDIEIKVNKRLILGLLNKLSELSVVLNNSDLDKSDTQYITFDETMNTYKKILQELQNQTTLAVDQKDVLKKIDILKTRVVDLDNEMEQLKTSDADVDQLGDVDDQSESSEEGESSEQEQSDDSEEDSKSSEEDSSEKDESDEKSEELSL